MILEHILPLLLSVQISASCRFTDHLPMLADKREWKSHIKSDGSNDVNVIFSSDTLKWQQVGNGTEEVKNWRCFMKIGDHFFLKRRSQSGGYFYSCVGILTRSDSVLQIQWSSESRLADPASCATDALRLDPWLLFYYETIANDFTACPVNGGYNVKHAGFFSLDIGDSRGYDIGCNLMSIPMRLEFDCIAGEGAMFDFRSSNCVPDSRMLVQQKTICVASWVHNNQQFLLLRKKNAMHFWCARFSKNSQNETELYLYMDLVCLDQTNGNIIAKYMKFDLQIVQYPNVCDDEYPECKNIACNAFTKQECQKTCGTCNPKRPPGICSFPRRFRGTWLASGANGNRSISFQGPKFTIDNVGEFDCVVFQDSPPRSTKTYTTVSTFQNGCRPRYTCVKFKRLGPSVIRYTLSQSIVWPVEQENIGSNICHATQFKADADPVRDLYRSYRNTGKPIVRVDPITTFIKCGLNSSYTIRAELPDESICHGGLYQHCADPTKIRFDFHTCNTFIRPRQDYSCVAIFRTNYWEKVLLVQSQDDNGDLRCIIFNDLRPYQALVVVSDECDKMATGFVDSFIRTFIMKLHIRPDIFPCKNVQLPTSTPSTTSATVVQTTLRLSTPNRTEVATKSKDGMNTLTLDLRKNIASDANFVFYNSSLFVFIFTFLLSFWKDLLFLDR